MMLSLLLYKNYFTKVRDTGEESVNNGGDSDLKETFAMRIESMGRAY